VVGDEWYFRVKLELYGGKRPPARRCGPPNSKRNPKNPKNPKNVSGTDASMIVYSCAFGLENGSPASGGM